MPTEIEAPEITDENRPSGVENATNRFKSLYQFEDQKPEEKRDEKPPEKPAEKPAEKSDVTSGEKPDATKPAAAPAEPKPVLDDAPPGNVVGKAADSWNAFKQKANKEIAARESKIIELQREVETANKTAQPIKVEEAPEFVALKKKHDELEAHFKVAAVERHPDFVKYFSEKTKSAIDLAKSVVGTELAPKLEKILRNPDAEMRSEQLEELASQLSAFKQGELATAVARLRDVESERAAEIEKAAKSYETLQAKTKSEREQSAVQQKAASEKNKKESLAFARETMDAFKMKDGDEAHNEAVKQNEAMVAAFFDGTIDKKLFSAIPALAAEAMHLRQTTVPQLQAELKKRDDIIAKYQSATPKLDDGGGDDTKNEPPAGGKFLAKMKELWPGTQK